MMWGLIFCMAATTVGTAMIARWCSDHAQLAYRHWQAVRSEREQFDLWGARPLMSREERQIARRRGRTLGRMERSRRRRRWAWRGAAFAAALTASAADVTTAVITASAAIEYLEEREDERR